MSTDPEPPAAPPAAPPTASRRQLRRSSTDRVLAGVASGLGEYTSVDPVLFRVLFAVAAIFGGAGALAYLIAWAVIPVEGTGYTPLDGWVERLRRHHIPPWLVAVVCGLLLWSLAFSWWSPHPPWPLLVLVLVPLLLVGTRDGGWRRPARPAPRATGTPPASGDGPGSGGAVTSEDLWTSVDAPAVRLDKGPASPAWATEARAWLGEARQASRERHRRSWPLRVAALTTLVAALTVLGVTDALVGIWLPVYFWVIGGIALVALLVGGVLRRLPWSLLPLLLVGALGTAAFGGTHASLHDGIGQQVWTPATAADVRGDYRLAFGQGVLDLRRVTPTSAHDIHVTLGAGQVRVLLPTGMNATVRADVRFGDVTVDGLNSFASVSHGWGERHRGVGTNETVLPPYGTKGAPVTIYVKVADGNVSVAHG
ncbi:PspC domain-containing protein [Pseudofrankia inefficax]|uniref:Phage shock protein C, PspC n=1 Tax=Pseudofrankia inefficax (strain DSM 45817 / CECT 9037 / DDB 130130 / EuI1c) TaxID=298654 RepID=E3JCT9_PSEI1|nr:PspC domain-containing protein [Pseudofrankia inefficax]ADP79929.1 phage shock protein C, PspC [Pseudofrankia inefficax]